MAGFFKKLFNRITGRPAEEAKPEVVEQVALPAPEEASGEVIEAMPEVLKAPAVKSKKVAPQKLEAKKPEPKKLAAKKPEAKKVEAKKPEPKKPEPKKLEVKKPEPKKVEAKKPEPKKVEPKKPEPKIEAKKGSAKVEVKKKLKTPEPPPLTPSPLRRQGPSLKATDEPVAKLDSRIRGHGDLGDSEIAATPVVEVAPEPVALPVVEVVEAPPPSVPMPVAEVPQRSGWFSRLKEGLSKSSKSIGGSITAIFTKKKLDKATLQDLEDTLIQADLGLPVAERIIAAVSLGRYDKEIDPEEVKRILASEVAKVLKPVEVPFNFGSEKPFVIAVVGVNGSGKTTTIGKLGSIASGEGFKVMFAAGDTFRAAAIEQLTIWGKRIGAETISRPTGADAAGLAFDALKEAQNNGTDILFIDTAGRLQNKAHLMDELDKMVRVIKKLDPTAPHAVLLVLDATTGQNALAQAEIFTKVAGVTGLIMTKLDGTARGGILVAIAEKFKLPIHAIGVGESIDDLQPFDADGFARAIAGLEET
ncbi:MAG: signal recognition particle-docking protein FtsY [Aestuariivirga sp.]